MGMIPYIFLAVLILFMALFFMVFTNQGLYLFIFEHKDYKLYKQIAKDIYVDDKITFLYNYNNYTTNLKYGDFRIVLWHNDKHMSVHTTDNECVLSHFWGKMSHKTYFLLCEKFQKDINSGSESLDAYLNTLK